MNIDALFSKLLSIRHYKYKKDENIIIKQFPNVYTYKTDLAKKLIFK